MLRFVFAAFALATCTGQAQAPEPAEASGSLSERKVQECACEGLVLEVGTPSGARVDCVSDQYAIEVEASQDWAEAIGQSLHYADQLDREAFIYLFCEQEEASCFKHQLRLETTIAAYDLPIKWEFVPDVCEQ